MMICNCLWNYVILQSLFLMCLLKMCAGAGCESKEFCGECIQDINCYWCIKPAYNESIHCLSKEQKSFQHCATTDIQDPVQKITSEKNVDLSDHQQMKPQRIKLSLRKNEKANITFQYKQTANYPVDLYYIMDLSYSMNPSKKKIAELGVHLAKKMRQMTNDFKIGFGSFVDKTALPFVDTHSDRPCTDCEPAYSFKNHLSLTQNEADFVTRVKNTKISGNLDSPEGGFDAIMQAIVCEKEIGWRDGARHLLVMSTDASSHIAGDGKLAGVIEPNDAKCHLKDNSYTEGLKYDYPSISHINYIARENNIHIIFAIVDGQAGSARTLEQYKQFSKVIENSKVGKLSSDSKNIISFISDLYDQIRTSVSITTNATKDVKISMQSDCKKFKNGVCENVTLDEIIDFTAVIEPLACHTDAKLNKKYIEIKPGGLKDNLIIELEVICDCECAKKTNSFLDNQECNGNGRAECGVCRCDKGKNGAKCQCDEGTKTKSDKKETCIKPGSNNVICSGQGECKCEKCECQSGFSGNYCECDNTNCERRCSDRGKCICGHCSCNPGYNGEACECTTDQSQCIARDTNEICSGHGECVCGKCKCKNEGTKRYSGNTCEECTNCPAKKCKEFKPCVECIAYQTGIYNSSECEEHCKKFQNISLVEKLEQNTDETTGAKSCRAPVDDDCVILFEYDYEQENLIIRALKEKLCPGPAPIFEISIGVVGLVVLVGIITLIAWKILTTIHDRNEYARFIEAQSNAQWQDNNLYKPGTTQFNNPAYKRASQRMSMMQAAKKSDANKAKESQ